MAIIALDNRDAIIQQVAEGKMLTQIAGELGIKAPNISKYLAQDPEYQQAREIGAELRLSKQYANIEEIANKTIDEYTSLSKEDAAALSNLARAREAAFKAATWFAEREFPDRWAQKKELKVTHNDLGDRLRRAKERVIEQSDIQDVVQDALPQREAVSSGS